MMEKYWMERECYDDKRHERRQVLREALVEDLRKVLREVLREDRTTKLEKRRVT